jgi:colanic acid biosynthesis glycosyl transferase WcaI
MTGSSKPSALFVTQYYWPESTGSAPYCTDMAEWLAQNGFDVRTITCRPHYPAGSVSRGYRDGSRDRQSRSGVAIERVPPLLLKRRGATARIAADAAFFLRGFARLARRGFRRPDKVVSLCPSILTVLLGVIAAGRRGQHVAVVHDIQSGLAAGLGMIGNGRLIKIMAWLERFVLNRVDTVLVLSENMRDHLRSIGVTTPIEILPLWVDTSRIRPMAASRRRPTVLYSGNFGKKQALGQIVEMADRLQQDDYDIAVVLRGDGNEAKNLADQVAARELHNVRFAPLVPAEKLGEGMAEGDIHLVPQDGNAADFAVPSKLFAIMAAGRPFVATARPGSLLWDLMDRSRAFLCAPSGDVEALTARVKRLAEDAALREELGRNGRSYVLAHHEKRALLRRFELGLTANGGLPVGHAAEPAPSFDL